MRETLSIKLYKTLRKGRAQLSREAQERIAAFVQSQGTASGAFMDKSGQPDLYYTVFGWTLARVLDLPIDRKKNRAYLNSIPTESLDLIHYAAYMRLRMLHRRLPWGRVKVKELNAFEAVPHNDRQSPYTQFIYLSLLEDCRNAIKKREKIGSGLNAYRVATGGYRNALEGGSATTNATVAALAVRGQLDGYAVHTDVRFLYEQQQSTGGFAAAAASPVPDLLSTATALFMLSCYAMKPQYPARDFIEAHWLDSGGFSATLLEEKSDVEYTFYGLLALGALQ